MKFIAEVDAVASMGDCLKVSLTNVRRKQAPDWTGYGHPITFQVPSGRAKSFPVGRVVEISVKPRVRRS